MKKRFANQAKGGFSLIEVMIAVAISAILVAVSYTAIVAHRVQNRKALEAMVMQGFAETYIEYLRNQPYDLVGPGRPVNALYDGTHPPFLRVDVPPAGTWESLLSNDYIDAFYPDLLLLSARQPELRVDIDERNNGLGEPRSKHIHLEVRWSRLALGGAGLADTPWITMEIDSTIFPNFQ